MTQQGFVPTYQGCQWHLDLYPSAEGVWEEVGTPGHRSRAYIFLFSSRVEVTNEEMFSFACIIVFSPPLQAKITQRICIFFSYKLINLANILRFHKSAMTRSRC